MAYSNDVQYVLYLIRTHWQCEGVGWRRDQCNRLGVSQKSVESRRLIEGAIIKGCTGAVPLREDDSEQLVFIIHLLQFFKMNVRPGK